MESQTKVEEVVKTEKEALLKLVFEELGSKAFFNNYSELVAGGHPPIPVLEFKRWVDQLTFPGESKADRLKDIHYERYLSCFRSAVGDYYKSAMELVFDSSKENQDELLKFLSQQDDFTIKTLNKMEESYHAFTSSALYARYQEVLPFIIESETNSAVAYLKMFGKNPAMMESTFKTIRARVSGLLITMY